MAKDLNIAILMDTYAQILTEKQREMLEYYYYEDLSLAEIAQNSGISRQGVRDAIKRGESVMLEFEEHLGFAQRQKMLLSAGEQIRRAAKDIKRINDKINYSDMIDKSADEILEALDRIEI